MRWPRFTIQRMMVAILWLAGLMATMWGWGPAFFSSRPLNIEPEYPAIALGCAAMSVARIFAAPEDTGRSK